MPLAMGSEFRVLISNLPDLVPFSGSRPQVRVTLLGYGSWIFRRRAGHPVPSTELPAPMPGGTRSGMTIDDAASRRSS